ncbi:hypothetical protein ABPG75_007671 [Micractinium tetrahymenae]
MGEFVPVPLPDEAEAGSVWREEKLRDFVFRLRCLGLDGDPEFAALAARIAEDTKALEELAEKQRSPDYQRPWWADGEYDAAKADSANDRGMELFTAGQPGAAFDCFTEAVRLRPTSAVYHANRAAAALKLGRADLTAEAAAEAARRDPGYLRAHLRLGRARLALAQPAEAEAAFNRALELEPGNATAKRGLEEAAGLAERQRAQKAEEAAAAAAGSRPGLSRGAVGEEEAVAQLYAAEQMLAANPRLQAARCAHIEALLLCQRYAEAEAGCSGLPEGSTERLYLEAEVAWRQGRLQAAADKLQQALQVAASSSGRQKCSSLLEHVSSLLALWEEAEAALEEGRPQGCADACSALLGRLEAPTACVGLACSALHRRAEAGMARQDWGAAVADLDASLALDAGHAPSLQLRAEAHKHAGDYTACFLDLQRLKKAAPGRPGLFALLQEAARLGLSGGGGGGGGGKGSAAAGVAARGAGGSAVQDALRMLGLPAGASSAQARQAYLKLAARWHPDKWAAASEEEQAAAGEKFKEVQAAYELLVAA